MKNYDRIIEATCSLIRERKDLSEVTVRDICKRAEVGTGLINYHFGSKDALIEVCVDKMINGVIEYFKDIRDDVAEQSPFERLSSLGNMTLDFLFDHYAISKISMLSDMRSPSPTDNTFRTYSAYIPLVSACRPDWSESQVAQKTFNLIAQMQSSFLRANIIKETLGVDLFDRESRHAYHTDFLHELLGI